MERDLASSDLYIEKLEEDIDRLEDDVSELQSMLNGED